MKTGIHELNLEVFAARCAQSLVRRSPEAKNADNMATKALGVLQENGVYASALFLASRKGDEKEQADVVLDEMLKLLDELSQKGKFGWPEKPSVGNSEKVFQYISENIAVNLERLLLAKETLEQMLIYARYGAKAAAKEAG